MEEIEAAWRARRPKEEEDKPYQSGVVPAGGKPWILGKGCDGGEEHNKWILGLVSMGGPRSMGQ